MGWVAHWKRFRDLAEQVDLGLRQCVLHHVGSSTVRGREGQPRGATDLAKFDLAERDGVADFGLVIAGCGLKEAHLPVPPTSTLPQYDAYCAEAGLTFVDRRYATWDSYPYQGGGYAVSVHRPPRGGLRYFG